MYSLRSSLVLAALLAAAPAAAAPVHAQPGRSSAMRAAVLVGVEDGRGPAGLGLRADGEMPLQPLGPGVSLSLVGSIGYSHRSDEAGWLDYRWESNLDVLRFIPSARFTFGQSSRIRPYADAGIGLYYASWEITEEDYWAGYPYYGWVGTKYSDDEVSVVLRFAGGVAFQLNDSLSIGAELALMPHLGDIVDDTTTSLMFGVGFRL
jgi:opacity protein-like surface antigen